MKKLVVFVFMLLVWGNSYGQYLKNLHIHLGLVANTIVTKNYLDDNWAKNSKEMNILISKRFYRSPAIFIQPELGYIQKGYKVEVDRTSETGERLGTKTYKFYGHFIHVLLPVGIRLIKFPHFFMQAGPRLTFKAASSDKYDAVINNYKTWMPGLVMVAGALVPVGNDYKIGAEVRYDFDITNGVNIHNDLYDKKIITKLNAWMFNLIFAF